MRYVSCMSATPQNHRFGSRVGTRIDESNVARTQPQKTHLHIAKKIAPKGWGVRRGEVLKKHPNRSREASCDPWDDPWCFRVLQDARMTSKMIPRTPNIYNKQNIQHVLNTRSPKTTHNSQKTWEQNAVVPNVFKWICVTFAGSVDSCFNVRFMNVFVD